MTERLDPVRLDALWDFSDPGASAERFAAESAEGAARQELETQRARALGLAGRGAEADAVLDGVDASAPVVAIRVELERGRRARDDGREDEAGVRFAEALRLAELEHEDFLAVDALHMLALVDEEHSGEWAARGILVVDATTDTRTKRWGIALHNNLGWTHYDAGLYPEALAEFELAATAADRYGTEAQRRLAREAIDETRALLPTAEP